MVWVDLKKIGHKMALSGAILGQILGILRILDQKNYQPFFGGKSYLQVLCNGSNKVTEPFFEFLIFRLFWALKRPKKGIFAYFVAHAWPKKGQKCKNKKGSVTF